MGKGKRVYTGTEMKSDDVGYLINLHRLGAYDDFIDTWVLAVRERLSQRRRILTKILNKLYPYLKADEAKSLERIRMDLRDMEVRDPSEQKLMEEKLCMFERELTLAEDRVGLLLERTEEDIEGV